MEMMTIIVCIGCILWIVLGGAYLIFDCTIYEGLRQAAHKVGGSRVLFVRAIDMIRIANIISGPYAHTSERHPVTHYKGTITGSHMCELQRHSIVTVYMLNDVCVGRMGGPSTSVAENPTNRRFMIPASSHDLIIWKLYYKTFTFKWR